MHVVVVIAVFTLCLLGPLGIMRFMLGAAFLGIIAVAFIAAMIFAFPGLRAGIPKMTSYETPGSSQTMPVQCRNQQQYDQLYVGEWFQDGTGHIYQKRGY
jgi:hypothetical protein